jgi:hypothetical protein
MRARTDERVVLARKTKREQAGVNRERFLLRKSKVGPDRPSRAKPRLSRDEFATGSDAAAHCSDDDRRLVQAS